MELLDEVGQKEFAPKAAHWDANHEYPRENVHRRRNLPNNVMMPHIKDSSMAKAFTGHAALAVVSESLQMFGAAGYSRDLPLERMMRDVRMFQIGGGTTQAQLTQIARSLFRKRRK